MIEPSDMLRFSPVRVVLGPGSLGRLGELARSEGVGGAVLLVTDPAITAAGHVDRACEALSAAGLTTVLFDQVVANPTVRVVVDGQEAIRGRDIDMIVGLGGGSVMDAAKGINLLHSGGGSIAEYCGDPSLEVLKRRPPLLPMVLIPTTAGTGSEAQSFALLSDDVTHEKLACGDRRPPRAGGLRPCAAILDPALTLTAPRAVSSAAGIDALSHAIESSACRARTEASRWCSRTSWRLLSESIEIALGPSGSSASRLAMLLGAHLAGCAVEHAMLGAAHACANPLTARFGVVHGVAVGLMLPHVIRFNAAGGENPYGDLHDSAEELACTMERWLEGFEMPRTLRAAGVAEAALPQLASEAAGQWTAAFNPRRVDADDLNSLYRAAW
jgi:alcohol dehydrogenase